MHLLTSFLILVLLDLLIVLFIFSILILVWLFIFTWISFSFLIKYNTINIYIQLDFILSKYFDIFWFTLGILLVWSLILRLIFILYYIWKALSAFDLLKIVGMQWYWLYILSDFDIFSNLILETDYFIGDLRLLQCNINLTLLSNTIYKIWLTSIDVIHSFTIPSLGIKIDCVPGRCNELFLYTNYKGTYYGQCSELCGILHGFMPITITFL